MGVEVAIEDNSGSPETSVDDKSATWVRDNRVHEPSVGALGDPEILVGFGHKLWHNWDGKQVIM